MPAPLSQAFITIFLSLWSLIISLRASTSLGGRLLLSWFLLLGYSISDLIAARKVLRPSGTEYFCIRLYFSCLSIGISLSSSSSLPCQNSVHMTALSNFFSSTNVWMRSNLYGSTEKIQSIWLPFQTSSLQKKPSSMSCRERRQEWMGPMWSWPSWPPQSLGYTVSTTHPSVSPPSPLLSLHPPLWYLEGLQALPPLLQGHVGQSALRPGLLLPPQPAFPPHLPSWPVPRIRPKDRTNK